MSVTSTSRPPVDHGPRVTSADPADFGYPTGFEEEWRFTPVADFHAVLDGRAGTTMSADSGPYVQTVQRDAVRRTWLSTDLPGAIASENALQTVLVDIPADTVIDEPIRVRLRGSEALSYGYVHIRLGSHASATVLVEQDLDRDTSVVMITELGPGAQAQVLSIADGSHASVHHLHWHAQVDRDATFTGLVVTLGGHRVRILPTASFAARGGSATLLGAFLGSAGQFCEHRLFVEHDQPHCSSNVVYKGALEGKGTRSVWIGDVLVRRGAVGTDTYELNRNLLLDDGPRADSVPNLELETGDIAGAGHASATGRFDDEQMFYLQARGIDEQTARQLVVRGFFADVLSRVSLPVEEAAGLISRIDRRLGLVATGGGDD